MHLARDDLIADGLAPFAVLAFPAWVLRPQVRLGDLARESGKESDGEEEKRARKGRHGMRVWREKR